MGRWTRSRKAAGPSFCRSPAVRVVRQAFPSARFDEMLDRLPFRLGRAAFSLGVRVARSLEAGGVSITSTGERAVVASWPRGAGRVIGHRARSVPGDIAPAKSVRTVLDQDDRGRRPPRRRGSRYRSAGAGRAGSAGTVPRRFARQRARARVPPVDATLVAADGSRRFVQLWPLAEPKARGPPARPMRVDERGPRSPATNGECGLCRRRCPPATIRSGCDGARRGRHRRRRDGPIPSSRSSATCAAWAGATPRPIATRRAPPGGGSRLPRRSAAVGRAARRRGDRRHLPPSRRAAHVAEHRELRARSRAAGRVRGEAPGGARKLALGSRSVRAAVDVVGARRAPSRARACARLLSLRDD